MAPGPLSAMTIAESARRGFRAGPLLTLGHAVAEALIVVTLALGLSSFFEHVVVKGMIAVVGGLVLVWMGVGLVHEVWNGRLTLAGNNGKGSSAGVGDDVRTGALVSVSNPYWILWWATVGANFVVMALGHGIFGLMIFFFGHIMSDLSWNSFLAFAVSSGRRVLNDRIYGAALTVCGGFLVLMGITFAWAGIGFLGVMK